MASKQNKQQKHYQKIPKEFILQELRKSGRFIENRNSAMMVCPWHNDTDPSLGVSLGGKVPTGVFHCLGCKTKGGWNKLALKLGLRSYGEDDSTEENYLLSDKIQDDDLIDVDSLTLSKLDSKWKHYSVDFLTQFEAQKLWHEEFHEYYMFLPISYLYDYKGFIRVRLFEEAKGPKYWFNFNEKILYPFDYVLEYDIDVLVLVEGIADAFRLLKQGIPALAILGTSLGETSFEMLELLDPELIVLMLDSDKAGRQAIEGYRRPDKTIQMGLKHILNNKGYKTKAIYPPKGHDPDSMPIKYVKKFRKLYKNLGGSLI